MRLSSRTMTRANAKALHLFMGLGIFVCAVCPLIEMACRSSDSIFATGSDLETTLALLFILMELSLLSLRLVRLLPALVSRIARWISRTGAFAAYLPRIVAPTVSPPFALRV